MGSEGKLQAGSYVRKCGQIFEASFGAPNLVVEAVIEGLVDHIIWPLRLEGLNLVHQRRNALVRRSQDVRARQ